MAWLESHQQLERHPKTHQLMGLMGWSLDETIGKLHRFWWWCLDFAPTGDLRKFNDAVLAGSVGLSADSSGKFVEAMVAACWLDRASGVFRVHDWPHYAGRYLKDSKFKRHPEKWREVVSLYEIEIPEGSADCPRTVDGLSPLPDQPNRTISTHPPGAREWPAWEQVKARAELIGLAEWKARDWFDEMQGCGWLDYQKRPIQDWSSVLNRVRTKWEADGRPSGPPQQQGGRNGRDQATGGGGREAHRGANATAVGY